MSFTYNFKNIDIADHLKQIFDLLNITTKMKGIKYNYDFKDLPINFTTDPNRL